MKAPQISITVCEPIIIAERKMQLPLLLVFLVETLRYRFPDIFEDYNSRYTEGLIPKDALEHSDSMFWNGSTPHERLNVIFEAFEEACPFGYEFRKDHLDRYVFHPVYEPITGLYKSYFFGRYTYIESVFLVSLQNEIAIPTPWGTDFEMLPGLDNLLTFAVDAIEQAELRGSDEHARKVAELEAKLPQSFILNDQERFHIIAALQLLRETRPGDQNLYNIATQGDIYASMTGEEIGDLITELRNGSRQV